jgi:uncharacterized damage-inducible protein DinB
MAIERDFIESSVRKMREYRKLAEDAMAQLTADELRYQPNENSNSVAQIITHMAGNMRSRWTNFLTEDGEKAWRNRDDEFMSTQAGADELMQTWASGWDVFFSALENLQDADLEKTVFIRQQPLTVTDAIVRQLTHYAMHIGQIVYLAKMMRNHDWKSLSIPRGQSAQYNASLRKI